MRYYHNFIIIFTSVLFICLVSHLQASAVILVRARELRHALRGEVEHVALPNEQLVLHQRMRGGLRVADGAHAQQPVGCAPAQLPALLAAV